MRILLAVAAVTASVTANIWPVPSSLSLGNSTLWISRDVKFAYSGITKAETLTRQCEAQHVCGQTERWSHDTRSVSAKVVKVAIERAKKTLFEQSFVPWKFHERGLDFEPSQANMTAIRSITLIQNATDSIDILKPTDGAVNEAYTLRITPDGDVTITGASAIGVSHGLTTFTQLFYKHSKAGVYSPYIPAEISDRPKFTHRGLNMDVARSVYEVKDILKTIDALAYSKMNRLHLHITDGQSWPLVIPALPELAAKGAYRPDLIYTPKMIDEIQQYGALQGVQVYLEIDMPGHTSSIHYAYPELVASFNMQPDWDKYAAEPPSGTLKLNSSAVSKFTETLFDDLLPRVAPYNAYFHTGGDEVNKNAYLNDDTVKSNDSAVLQPLMQKFVDHNHELVRKYGLTPVVWEEMLLSWNITLGSDVIVQTWQSDEAVAQTVAKGHKALAGNYNYWYLDCGHGQWLNFQPGSSSRNAYPYTDYCSPRKSWRLVYSYDPLSGVPEQDQHLVIGGEVHIWSEQTDPVNLDRNVWPRAAAAAEVLWSGPKDSGGQNRSQVEAAPRLSQFRERLVARGVGAEPIQMPFCTMGKSQCSL